LHLIESQENFIKPLAQAGVPYCEPGLTTIDYFPFETHLTELCPRNELRNSPSREKGQVMYREIKMKYAK
jgi:hypothetical protein